MQTRRQILWLAASAAICVAVLATVHVMERFGYLPCELCLRQREVYWTALAVAVVALVAGRFQRIALAVGVVALAVAFAVGAAVAGYHAGVEWKWWAGPTACTGRSPAPISAANVLASLDVKQHLVRCDEAAFRLVGVSLSGWNALLSAALSLASILVLVRPRKRL